MVYSFPDILFDVSLKLDEAKRLSPQFPSYPNLMIVPLIILHFNDPLKAVVDDDVAIPVIIGSLGERSHRIVG